MKTKVGYRQISSRRLERYANFSFQAAPTLGIVAAYSIGYRLRRLCSMVNEDEAATWLEHKDSRHRKIPTVPGQLTSRLEDQLTALKGWGYKQKVVDEQFQKALDITRETALMKVIKVKEEKLILSLP